jgi:hypothetical protein
VNPAPPDRPLLRLVRPAAWLAVLAAVVCTAGGHAQPNAPRASERALKAAYLYKFAEYVDWPDAALLPAGQPFTIGVLGAAALADDLQRMTADRTLDDRPITVRRVTPSEALDDLDVLFIADGERGRLSELLSPVKGRPILTVTESAGALADGSIINFTVSGERVRFEVSLDAAQANRLKLSSRLLAVAASVQQSQ